MDLKFPSRAGAGEEAEAKAALDDSTGHSRQALRAGRSRLSGWAGQASLGTNLTPPGAKERGSQGCVRGDPGAVAAPLLGREGELELSHRSLFKLAHLGERRPGLHQRPARAWRWGRVARAAAFRPDTRNFGGEAVRTRSQHIRGLGTPR